jgi:hypothetical protein
LTPDEGELERWSRKGGDWRLCFAVRRRASQRFLARIAGGPGHFLRRIDRAVSIRLISTGISRRPSLGLFSV